MKVRIGYVTNSSSTNFLILSKKELTEDYLYKMLGFKKNSRIEAQARELCRSILEGTYRGIKYEDSNNISYKDVKDAFGEYAATKYDELTKKGYEAYAGYTDTDDGYVLTSLFTTDTFEYEKPGFYINGRICMW